MIDAQIHQWTAGSSPRHGSTPFLAADALAGMDAAGIHPPGWDPDATRYAATAINEHPNRFAAYATLALDQSNGPDLKLVIDHFGMIGYDGGLTQSPDILDWARHTNVAVTLTGAPDYATDQYPFPGMRDVVHELCDAYGPHRLFWGSDITRGNGHGGTRHKATWRECVTMFTEHMPWPSDADLTLVMGTAYRDWRG